MAFDWSLLGAGLGTLPSLWQMLNGGGPAGGAASQAQNAASQVIAAAGGGPNTAAGTPTAPTPTTSTPQNPNVNNAQLSALAAAMGVGQSAPSGQQPMNMASALNGVINSGQPSTLPGGAQTLSQPRLSGPMGSAGPNPAAMSPIGAATALAAPQLASGISGAPLGPAAANPMLLALLRQRLGMA